MNLDNILQIVGMLGVAGVAVWLLRKLGLLRGPASHDQGSPLPMDRASQAARERESQARRAREAADAAAIEEIGNRSRTGDPAADLADRVYRRAGRGQRPRDGADSGS